VCIELLNDESLPAGQAGIATQQAYNRSY